MNPRTLIKDDYRLTVTDGPDRRIKIDYLGRPSRRWINVLSVPTADLDGAIAVLRDGDLFIKRLAHESDGTPLPPVVRRAAGRLPSTADLLRDRCAEVQTGEFVLTFLPYTGDAGYTNFAVDMFRLPGGGEPRNLAQLGHGQIPAVMSLLVRAAGIAAR